MFVFCISIGCERIFAWGGADPNLKRLELIVTIIMLIALSCRKIIAMTTVFRRDRYQARCSAPGVRDVCLELVRQFDHLVLGRPSATVEGNDGSASLLQDVLQRYKKATLSKLLN